MKILDSQINDEGLTKFGAEAINLLKIHNHEELASRFGYALSFGKKTAQVIQTEISSCLSQARNGAKLSTVTKPLIVVNYFEPNNSNLIAVVECTISIDNGIGEILMELIVA